MKLAYPDRPVVALVGDGSSMYSVQSFWTAAHHHIPVVYIILSNRTYRILKFNMNRYRRTLAIPRWASLYPPGFDQPDPGFCRNCPWDGRCWRRITRPEEIQSAVTEALEMDAPYVLEVVTEGRIPAQ